MAVHRPRHGEEMKKRRVASILWIFAPAALAATHSQIPLWDAPAIEAACTGVLKTARTQVAALEKVRLSQATVGTVLRPWDRLQILLEDTQGPVEIMTNMSPDAKARAAGEVCLLKMNEFNTELFQNENLFARIQRAAPADAVDRKLKKDVVEAFEDTGVALPPDKR